MNTGSTYQETVQDGMFSKVITKCSYCDAVITNVHRCPAVAKGSEHTYNVYTVEP